MQAGLRTFLAAAVLALGAPGAASAATFVVNNNGNASDSSVGNGVCRTSGNVCTLRAAIQEANATTALDTINFAIGTGLQRITISSALPTITRPVIIDGWSQPGFSGAPLIELHGSNVSSDGIKLQGGGSTLRGLIVNNFGDDGIHITGSGGNVIEGCYVGTNADGSAPDGNDETGIRIETANNRVGGTQIAQRNVVSGNKGRGTTGAIYVYGEAATGNIIQGNFIGLDATGMFAMGNEARGVALHNAPANFVGGLQPGAGNLIAGNRATGVRMWGEADGNYILANWIGVNRLGEMQVGLWPEPGTLSNARGVQMRSDNNIVAYNFIAGNSYEGVLFYDGWGKDYEPTATASNNLVYGNIITANGMVPFGPDGPGGGIIVNAGSGNKLIANSIYGNLAFGINLQFHDWDSIDANDFLDADDGGNKRQNYPELWWSSNAGGQTTVHGKLHSSPNGTFTLLFYSNTACDPSGHGEGRFFLGGTNVVTNGDGDVEYSFPLGQLVTPGWALSATAMDADGNTSEFAYCLVVQ
jgi:parallel beta-helix repeat protein